MEFIMSITFRAFVLCFAVAVSFSQADAGPFEPKIEDVCTNSASNPKKLVLNPKLLVGQLLEKHAGITALDLDRKGDGVIYPQNAEALVNPVAACANNKCGKDVEKKLGVALIDVIAFINRHQDPIPASQSGIDARPLAGSLDFKTGLLRQFFLGLTKIEAVCSKGSSTPAAPGSAGTPSPPQQGAGTETAAAPGFFSLRQNVEDLPFSQDDQKFKGLKQASVSIVSDRVAVKSTFAVDAATGYTFGRMSFDEEGRYIGQITPFVVYNQQFVETATPAKNSRAQNVGFGVLGDLTFPAIFGGYQNVQFYPKYVTSLVTDARVLSGNFVYTPMFGIPGIDSVYYLIPEMLSFKLTPQVKAVVHDVLDAGTDAALLKKGTYYWVGPRTDLMFYGEGLLAGYTLSTTYERYRVLEGLVKNVYFLQTALNYDFGKAKLMSIQLKYQKGRNLDTLERIEQITLGLGLKF
jgi:hypothetical protein